jgi:ABC-2 type transport system ATP-binding protein
MGSRIELIDAADSPRQARWLLHAGERSAIEAARGWPGVIGVEVDSPSLEDIYIAYMRRRMPGPAAGAAVVAAY